MEVEEILTPRVDVIAVEDDLSLDEVADTFAESGYSRLPVYHGTIDNIIGCLLYTSTTRVPMGEALDTAQPVVEYLPGWHCDITAARKWEDLPKEARDYVEYLSLIHI